MNITVPKKSLLALLARCRGVADPKSAQPILANVLIVAEPGIVRASATDLYRSITGDAPADVKEDGSVAVDAKDLFERVKAMPDGPLHLSTTDASLTIKGVGSARRYTLPMIPGADFPVLPTPEESATSLMIGANVLALLIARTHFSISTDETRAHVNSALFEWAGDRVRMVTTDGHRLSKMEATVSGSSATATMLIPLKAITELRRLAEESRAEKETPNVSITQSGPNAFFNIAGMQFSVKLVDAQFPPYDQVIPRSSEHEIAVSREAFSDAVRAVSISSNERTGGVVVNVANDTLKITSRDTEGAEGSDEVSVDFSGPSVSIGLNAKYALDVLDAIDSDEVTLGISGELDPATIRASDGDTQDCIFVIMPMRM